jgi:predicted RNA binding protein YcfA (HicA-like mRNA interferase family)
MTGRRERIVIPIHGNQPLKKGLLRSLMNIAGLQEDDL